MIRRDIWAAVVVLAGLATVADLQAQENVVRDLIGRLRQDDSETKISAIDTLADLGPAAKSAVPALTAALAHQDASVRHHAARALGSIGPDASSAIDALTARCRSAGFAPVVPAGGAFRSCRTTASM